MTAFYVAEVSAYRPGAAASVPAIDAHATSPNLALEPVAVAVAQFDTLRGSDAGYRTRQSDPGGLQVYPPVLSDVFSIDRRVHLAPGEEGAGAAWGSVRFSNIDGRYDAIAATNNSDGRPVLLRYGQKGFDSVRGIDTDPPAAALIPIFSGLALPWFCSDTALDVPMRDATYWLERPVQASLYAGTGGLAGGADLTGLPMPMARGGTPANPIRNVPAVRVDTLNRIFQWTDGSGELVNLYEGGQTGFTFGGDVADLYTGTTAPGAYRTNKARGLFQLGSPQQRAITCDVTGDFVTPSAGSVTTIMGVLRWLLLDDMRLPAGSLDVANLAAADAAYPYTAGVWIGTTPVQGTEIAGYLTNSIAAKLVPSRTGQLRVLVLRPVTFGATAAARYGTQNIVAVTPRPLGAPLDPPPFRWRVGYQRNHSITTSDIASTVSDTRKAFLAAEYRYAAKSSSAVLQAFNRPSDPPAVNGALLVQADAQAVANALDAMWGGAQRRRQYDVVLPVAIGIGNDFGDVVGITWPMDNLPAGPLGQVVGEQFRSSDATTTITVLI